MKVDINLLIVCVTSILIAQIIMHGLWEITNAKNSGKVIGDNFNDILENIDKFEKIKKGF